jgi:hypothetical protein
MKRKGFEQSEKKQKAKEKARKRGVERGGGAANCTGILVTGYSPFKTLRRFYI